MEHFRHTIVYGRTADQPARIRQARRRKRFDDFLQNRIAALQAGTGDDRAVHCGRPMEFLVRYVSV
ncbi:hypothetical protein D3C85_1943920 [compost metagenome]